MLYTFNVWEGQTEREMGMNSAQHIRLCVHLTEAQLEYLAARFPHADPEIALVKLLEQDRLRALRRAEARVQVLHRQAESKPAALPVFPKPNSEIVLPSESENPVGALQEYCQQKQLPFATYEFETIADGFRCTVQALGEREIGEGCSKKTAKFEAAAKFLKHFQKC